MLKNAPLPSARDRRFIPPEELRKGVRLACALPDDFAGEIEIAEGEEMKTVFPMGELPSDISFPLKADLLAIDLGTTTIAMALFDRNDGHLLSSWQGINAQRAFGTDVISRLQAAEEGHAAELTELIRAQLSEGIAHCLAEREGDILLAGNTAMLHLLLDYPVEGLSRGSGIPHSLDACRLSLGGRELAVLPGFSAFVGADIFADLYGLLPETDFLLLDIGTNAEMVISRGVSLLATSTPGGPAFERFAPVGVYGAQLVKALARLLREGRMDATGLLQEPFFSHGVSLNPEGKQFTLFQRDIRELQKAKAAAAAGMELLIRQQGMPERICLAGGFGFFLDPADAVEIGLFPPGFKGQVELMGNAVLTGILRYYAENGRRAQEIRGNTGTELLAENPDFAEAYIRHMAFGQGHWIFP